MNTRFNRKLPRPWRGARPKGLQEHGRQAYGSREEGVKNRGEPKNTGLPSLIIECWRKWVFAIFNFFTPSRRRWKLADGKRPPRDWTPCRNGARPPSRQRIPGAKGAASHQPGLTAQVSKHARRQGLKACPIPRRPPPSANVIGRRCLHAPAALARDQRAARRPPPWAALSRLATLAAASTAPVPIEAEMMSYSS